MPVTGANLSSVYGITANYFKIGQMYVDFTTNTGFVNYLGYETEKNAYIGVSPIKSIEIRLEPADVTGIYGLANTQSNLSVTGASVFDYIDTIMVSGSKPSSLEGKTKTNYPSGAYPCEECGGGYG